MMFLILHFIRTSGFRAARLALPLWPEFKAALATLPRVQGVSGQEFRARSGGVGLRATG